MPKVTSLTRPVQVPVSTDNRIGQPIAADAGKVVSARAHVEGSNWEASVRVDPSTKLGEAKSISGPFVVTGGKVTGLVQEVDLNGDGVADVSREKTLKSTIVRDRSGGIVADHDGDGKIDSQTIATPQGTVELYDGNHDGKVDWSFDRRPASTAGFGANVDPAKVAGKLSVDSNNDGTFDSETLTARVGTDFDKP